MDIDDVDKEHAEKLYEKVQEKERKVKNVVSISQQIEK